MSSVHKNGSYNSGNMSMNSNNTRQNMPSNIPSSHHSMNKNMNMSPRNGSSPRSQSHNGKINNGSFNNSPRDMAIPKSSYHLPNNNQRTHSLNNPLSNSQVQQPPSQNSIEGSIANHNRRSSSLGMMKDGKRNSIGYAVSPVNQYPPSQNSGSSSVGIPNEINRPPRPLSTQSAKKVHRLSNTSYLNSPNSLEMETEQINHPITESSNQNFLSVDNQINSNMERNTPSISSVPNYYPNQPIGSKAESIRSAPSIKSNFTLSGISDNNSQRSFTIKSNFTADDIINRNNTYPLNKNMMEGNEQIDPTKSYTIPKEHGKSPMYNEDENNLDYYSQHSKQNSISYLLNPSQGKRMQEQMMPNDTMDTS
jgi:hypothetical protein